MLIALSVSTLAYISCSVIVRHFYIVSVVIAPNEANPVLIVNANAVLSSAVAV